MKEQLLHYVWQYKLFNTTKLTTVSGERIRILQSGVYNRNSGPDFLNAKIELENLLWFGHVEIHIKSSDWYAHHHENDTNYDAVVLHVVYEHDVEVFTSGNRKHYTVALKEFIDQDILIGYEKLFAKEKKWIPCEREMLSVGDFTLKNWLERLYFERLEHKSKFITDLLKTSNFDFEAVLFKLLAKNFGLKVNGEAFLKLAESIDFSILRKERFDAHSLAALLFGQAGFLDEDLEENYYLKLRDEYKYIKHKYQLKTLPKQQFQFFRMRPNNFPTIRLAQLVALYHKTSSLFSELMHIGKLEDYYKIFSIEVNNFWKKHYTFDKVSKQTSKQLTKPFIDLLLINTIIPLKFVYMKQINQYDEEELLSLIRSINAEKNTIISKFMDMGIAVNSALESQSLLQLHNNYCIAKSCLSCAIGNFLIRGNE